MRNEKMFFFKGLHFKVCKANEKVCLRQYSLGFKSLGTSWSCKNTVNLFLVMLTKIYDELPSL